MVHYVDYKYACLECGSPDYWECDRNCPCKVGDVCEQCKKMEKDL